MGTSADGDFYTQFTEDHPHAYGDKELSFLFSSSNLGSSPRVWGQDQVSLRLSQVLGIIPTRMGTRTFSSSYSVIGKDHPHAYGDKVISLETDTPSEGSSPRVWGQVFHSGTITTYSRIIPTRMGTRSAHQQANKDLKDHPHAYGDKYFFYNIIKF